MATKRVEIQFVGDGSRYIMGIPARDLTKEEFAALSKALQKQCIQSGLYLMPDKKEAKDA